MDSLQILFKNVWKSSSVNPKQRKRIVFIPFKLFKKVLKKAKNSLWEFLSTNHPQLLVISHISYIQYEKRKKGKKEKRKKKKETKRNKKKNKKKQKEQKWEKTYVTKLIHGVNQHWQDLRKSMIKEHLTTFNLSGGMFPKVKFGKWNQFL